MLKSYLSVALRQLATNKVYSLINVAGLAIGLASVVLIALFVRHELGYDSFWAKADRIYRISRDYYARDPIDPVRLRPERVVTELVAHEQGGQHDTREADRETGHVDQRIDLVRRQLAQRDRQIALKHCPLSASGRCSR